MKVLVADDSAMLREKLIGLLSEVSGVQIVGHAQEAQETLQAVCKLKPDVVTMNIQMIGGSGMDVLKKIKQAEQPPIVIMLTNRTSSPYRKRCIEAGADFFLDKSTEFGKVREIVQGLLDGLIRE
jgi:DNA-binding NarL/FixJ family response regulator